MSEAFDPYHKWLAIPAEEQPPNNYRLLGVHLFETDADVIESAADRQMGHVRGFATGQRGELSQKILNEISAAKVTLLNPVKRAAYDTVLRKELAAKQPAAKPLPKAQALPTAQSLPRAQTLAAEAHAPNPQLRTRGQHPQPAAATGMAETTGGIDIPLVARPKSVSQRRKKKSSPVLTFIALLAVAGVMIGALLILMNRQADPPAKKVAKVEKNPVAKPPAKVIVIPNRRTRAGTKNSTAGGLTDEEQALAEGLNQDSETDAENFRAVGSTRTPGTGQGKLVPGPPVDLLADLDLEQAVVGGTGWALEDGVLTTGQGSRSRIQIPLSVPEYVLTLTAERVQGSKHLILGLPVAGGQLACGIDINSRRSPGKFASGYYDEKSNPLLEKVGDPLLPEGEPVRIVCLVTKDALVLRMDGKVIGDWKPDGRELKVNTHWAVQNKQTLLLGVGESEFKISQLEYRPLARRKIASSTSGSGSGQMGSSPPVDLLANLDLRKAIMVGRNWQLDESSLTTGWATNSRIQIPFPVTEYVLRVTAERIAGSGHLVLGLPVERGQVMCCVDNSFERTDGKFATGFYDGETTLMEKVGGSSFAAGKPVTITCQIQKENFILKVNGKFVGAWRRDARPLKLSDYWAGSNQRMLILGAFNTNFKITQLEYIPTAGITAGPDTDKIVGAFGEKVPGERDPDALASGSDFSAAEPPSGASGFGGYGKKSETPTEEKQAETLVVLQDLFPDEYAAAKSTAGKLALGKKLYETAQSTRDDPVALYVLLNEAKNYAAEGGNAEVPMRALETLNRDYKVDLVALYVETFDKVLKGARSRTEHRGLIHQIKRALAAAQAEDRFEEAEQLMRIAQSSARVTRDADVIKEVAASAKQLRDAESEFDKVSAAKEKLATDPDDAEANAEWGRYLCVVRNDFAQGMPLLAKGADAQLKAVAKADLDSPNESKEQIAVGDKWFALADAASGSAENMLRLRAGFWYQRGVLGLTGLEKTRIDKRLSDIRKIDRDGIPQPQFTAPSTQPPQQAPVIGTTGGISMVGRVMLDGQDIGVSLTYRLGQAIDGRAVRQTLSRLGVSPDARLELNLAANLLLKKTTELNFHIAGGSSSGGVCYLEINKREIAAVGDDRSKDTTIPQMLPAGVYLIGLRITGGELGNCVLECKDAESDSEVPFQTEMIAPVLRKLPTKATLDLGQLNE